MKFYKPLFKLFGWEVLIAKEIKSPPSYIEVAQDLIIKHQLILKPYGYGPYEDVLGTPVGSNKTVVYDKNGVKLLSAYGSLLHSEIINYFKEK